MPTSSSLSNAASRLLVTGSRGRVAQAIRTELGAEWDIVGVSRDDVDDVLDADGAIGARAVVHCAWSSVPANAVPVTDPATHPDLVMLQRWIARLRRDPSPPLFVFMSTGAVYGDAKDGPSGEDDALSPRGAYAQSKALGEQLLLASGLPVCILRVAPLYGLPEGEQKLQGVISHLLAAALDGRPFQQWGDDTVKDYLHSSDFCEALRRVLAQDLHGVWNLGSGEATSLSELMRLAAEVTGQRLAIEKKSAPEWDVRDNRLDVSRLQQAIEWQATTGIREGMKREVERLRRKRSELV